MPTALANSACVSPRCFRSLLIFMPRFLGDKCNLLDYRLQEQFFIHRYDIAQSRFTVARHEPLVTNSPRGLGRRQIGAVSAS